MTAPADPYLHHPELRGEIADPESSFFRTLDIAAMDAHLAANGHGPDWRYTCEEREAMRRDFFAGYQGDALWVFAYGSLMWDPGIRFTEVRRAHVAGFARSFCILDDGGRGTREAPGLMLAMDRGAGCTGLAFRVAAEDLEEESFQLWRREMITPAYLPVFVDVETQSGAQRALTFVADRALEDRIRPDIPFDEQVRMIAAASGILGSNRAYLENVVRHLSLMGIEDPSVTRLAAAVAGLPASA
jgi:cation transport protein ChaC